MALSIADLGRPRVLVAGDLLLDRYVWGQVDRISPEAPIPVLAVRRQEPRPGGAANVARNLAALGARVSLAGVVGNDAAGRTLLGLLRAEGIDTGAVVRTRQKPTPVKTRMIAHSQQMLRVDEERTDPIAGAVEAQLAARVGALARGCDLAVVSDYDKGTMAPRVARAALRSRALIVGLKTPRIARYAGATGAMLNLGELVAFTGVSGEEAAARALSRRLRLEFLVVTLGERGLFVRSRAGTIVRMPTVARAVYDVTGAGDTCLAAFAVAYASGRSLPDCAAIANAAAGIVVGKLGTEIVTLAELKEALRGEDPAGRRKIVEGPALARSLAEARACGRRVVFTNGCFDLLHSGHLALLDHARRQGDVLVVGLNTDRTAHRLKGPGRPIQPQDVRARILAALTHVDHVVLFDEPTPERLIRQVRPDVLVKGADWKGKGVVGADFVRGYGGKVVLAPLVPGHSTSALVQRMRR